MTDLAPSNGGVWGDYDNDGHVDLSVVNPAGAGIPRARATQIMNLLELPEETQKDL